MGLVTAFKFNSLDAFEKNKNVLEKLFGAEWFDNPRNSRHSAYVRWAFCNQVISQNGKLCCLNQKDNIPLFASMCLDAAIFSTISDSDLDELLFDGLDNYSCEEVRNKIKRDIVDPDDFHNIMTELYVGAWHKWKKHKVEQYEEAGSDFKVIISGYSVPILLDCKQLEKNSKCSRIRKVILKANEQVNTLMEKKTDGVAHGYVLLDVTHKIGVEIIGDAFEIPTNPGSVMPNIKIEQEMGEIRDSVRAAIKSKNSSIGAVVIARDQISLCYRPDIKATFVAFKRITERMDHLKANFPLPQDIEIFKGISFTHWIQWEPQ